ncbi:MAG: hypothetical protein DMG49_05390 [Acidobacteria bacterium]|nr:MAG: hypothetical protein DMG49_05390 [Acidobacteriota bacterium]
MGFKAFVMACVSSDRLPSLISASTKTKRILFEREAPSTVFFGAIPSYLDWGPFAGGEAIAVGRVRLRLLVMRDSIKRSTLRIDLGSL